jgi:hypothetical protein
MTVRRITVAISAYKPEIGIWNLEFGIWSNRDLFNNLAQTAPLPDLNSKFQFPNSKFPVLAASISFY